MGVSLFTDPFEGRLVSSRNSERLRTEVLTGPVGGEVFVAGCWNEKALRRLRTLLEEPVMDPMGSGGGIEEALPPEEALINVHRMPANSNTTSIVVELRMGTGV